MFRYLKFIQIIPLVLGVSTVVFFGFLTLLYFAVDNSFKLEIINTMAQIVVAVSALLAFVNYFESKKERQIKEAINLITFFREEIISVGSDITKLIVKDKGEKFIYERVELFDVIEIEKSYLKLNKDQFNNLSSISNNSDVLDLQITLLNKLEEFALSVSLYSLEGHQALATVRAAFVQFIETHIYVITLQRTVGTAPDLYNQTLCLYSKWKFLVDRQTPEVRLNILKENIRKNKHTTP